MATTTPNFGWVVPTSTDLVKDGATAIETLGDSIDASMAELKGGTTGQVLSKTSNTDMDFTWVAQDDSNAIQNAIKVNCVFKLTAQIVLCLNVLCLNVLKSYGVEWHQ